MARGHPPVVPPSDGGTVHSSIAGYLVKRTWRENLTHTLRLWYSVNSFIMISDTPQVTKKGGSVTNP